MSKINNKKKYRIQVNFLKIKRKCLFVVKLKANKCYQESLCYLLSYINLLNIWLF